MPGDSAGQVFDVAAFERQTGGDADFRHDIIGMFLEDCPVRVAAVRAAVERRDAAALVSAAHSLKGACGYLSAVAALLPELRKQLSMRKRHA